MAWVMDRALGQPLERVKKRVPSDKQLAGGPPTFPTHY
jgi:hypothetical protein